MRHDRSPTRIRIANLLLCMVSAVIVAATPTKAKIDGLKPWIRTSVSSAPRAKSDARRSIPTALHPVEPRHWHTGVDLYSDRKLADARSRPRARRRDRLSPQITVLVARDVALDDIGQTVNVVSLDMDRDGKFTLRDPAYRTYP
jgi:hypothetical protein